MTIIDVDAINSNLEDFKLKDIEEQGASALKEVDETQNLVYYFVTPIYKKKIVITYYNTKTKNMKDVTIPLLLQNELVSTQTDLNPNDSSFEKYKKIAAIFFFIVFFLLFVWKRKRVFLIISGILLIISIIYLLPNEKGIVKKDSNVYILPTRNSTIFFKLENNQNIEVLDKKNGFIKVLGVDSEFIGWIKEAFVFLEHGAMYAIGILAAIMLYTGTGGHVPEVVTGLIGVAFIIWAIFSSIAYEKRQAKSS